MRVSNSLRRVDLEENVVGFCYDLDRSLFINASLDHGPLLVGLDTNVLIDLAEHGEAAFDKSELPESVREPHVSELASLAALIELWLVRDIRFIPLNRSLTDTGRGISADRMARRVATMQSLSESLAHLSGEWALDDLAPMDEAHVQLARYIDPALIPGVADRELVQESCRLGLDVFLTRDVRVVKASGLPQGWPTIESPKSLVARLTALGVEGFRGGMLNHPNCAYASIHLFPSMDKWAGLLSALGSASN